MAVDIRRDKQTIIAITGDIDFGNVDELKSAISAVIKDSDKNLIIDLSGADHFDSSGIAAVFAAYRFLRPERKLSVVVGNDTMKRVFGILHVDNMPGLFVVDDLPSAIKAIEADS